MLKIKPLNQPKIFWNRARVVVCWNVTPSDVDWVKSPIVVVVSVNGSVTIISWQIRSTIAMTTLSCGPFLFASEFNCD